MPKRLVRTAARLIATTGILVTPALPAEAILTRDQNPFLTGFGLPVPFATRIAAMPATQIDLILDWSSSATIQLAGDEELVADAETRGVTLLLQHRFDNGLAMRVRVPWIDRGPGVLDSFIEDWHDALGLPQGSRRRLPHDQYLVGYARDREVLYLRTDGAGGVGDIALDLGLGLYESSRWAAGAWLTIELPTGNESGLLGSGALDAALTLTGGLRLWDGWSVYGQASYTRLGTGDFLPASQRDHAWSGLAGIAWDIARRVTIKAQVNAHTAVFDRTDIEFLGDAAIVTIGAEMRPAPGWYVTFAVGEDLDVKASPDVNFHFALRREF